MQTTNFGISARGAGRAAVGVFVICMLIVSGLFWGGTGASGKIKVDPRSPIAPESLEGLEMRRLDLSSKFARWNSYYCGTSSYDAAWIGFVGGRDVCMTYKAQDNEFWLVKGDLFIPLSTDIIFLHLSAGETEFIFFGCDEGALVCSNPAIMPPASGLDINGRDNLVIETVSTEDASVEPEGVEKLKERVARLSNSPWFAKLCYVTDTLSYSDNCQDENAPPMNFAVRKADLDTRNSFTLTWYWDSSDSNGPRHFPASVYFRDIETTSPAKVTCAISEAGWITAGEGYQTYTCTGHTLEFEGNFIVIGSDETAAASGGTILSLPKPEVHVVAMEVTQGLQNWDNTVTLVKNRRTAVRVFMETSVLPRKITAELKGTKVADSARTELHDSPRPSINYENKVEVRANVTERRGYMGSSLNFLLPDDWVNLDTGEELELELVFTERNINCSDKCVETVNFIELTHLPNIVMVPLSVRNDDDGSIAETQETDLDEQFQRILSVLPLPNIEYTPFDEAPRKHMFTPFDSIEPISRREHISYYARRLSTLQGRGPINYIYLGVLLGEEDCDLASGQAIDIGGSAAVWYTGGENDGTGILSQSGEYRNIGGHELGHVLDQEHPIRARNQDNRKDNGSYRGECKEESRAKDIYPYFYKIGEEGRYNIEDKKKNTNEEEDTLIKEDKGWRPALGPLGSYATPETEVWGLDTRFVYPFPQIGYSDFAVIDPNIIFSLMSYCGNGPTTVDNQGRWIDSYHHKEIIDLLSLNFNENSNFNDISPVSSDLFSGSIFFSEEDSILNVELDSVFSETSYSGTLEDGEFLLELRDKYGSAVRSIPFAVHYFSNHDDPEVAQEASFSFVVTDPPEYDSFAVIKNGNEITAINRSMNAPDLSVAGMSMDESFYHDDIINIDWEGSDADGDDLLYRVYYSTDGGVNYQVLSLDTEETSMSIQAGLLAGSDNARIGVSVSDGTRSTVVETPIFSVTGNVPEVSIESPASGSVISSEQVIVLDAFGYDREDGYLGSSAFSWHSNIDGNLGAGNLLVVPASDLSIGEHVITATATDSDQMTTSASVILTINTHNTAPDAIDDTASAVFGRTVQIDVFVNDIDLENDTDLDTLVIYEQPAFGETQIVISPNGRPVVEYVASNQGTDVFSYEICDYGDRCDTAQITVTVVVEDCTITGTDGDDILGDYIQRLR